MPLKLLPLLALLGTTLLLAGCNQSQHMQSAQSGAPAPIGTQNRITSALPSSYTLQIAPIVGAPEETVLPLIQRINAIAQSSGIPMSANGEPAPDLILKGYFSNLSEDKDIHVLYVWDIMDSSGRRVHRLRGEVKSINTLNQREDWSIITAQMMQNIADKTMKDYSDWIISHR